MKYRSAASAFAVLLGASASGQVTQRLSLSSAGAGAIGWNFAGAITPDGRYASFSSGDPNLTLGDMNGRPDVYLRDRETGTTELVSVNSLGVQGNDQSVGGWMSADGRYVAFTSYATNLAAGDTNALEDAFVHDRVSGTTELMSVSSGGVQGNSWTASGPITPDGRFVVMYSTATNLDPPSLPGQIYVRDRLNGTTELASLGQGGVRPNHESWGCTISDDGRFVCFVSLASNLVPGDTNYDYDIFVRDRLSGTTERVDVSTTGAQSSGDIENNAAWISGNGRFVAFMKGAGNLVPGDTNGVTDIFVRDRLNRTTERVSVGVGGVQANGASERPTISADGRYVAFASGASNLAPEDPNAMWNVFVHDRRTGTNEAVDVGWNGQMANNLLGTGNSSISADGRFVVYDSTATNLVPGPTEGWFHVYVRDRIGGLTFTSLCDPGDGEVHGCPCSNPPAGPGRGCDNSAGTGGAALTATGGTFLTSDSLRFQATRLRPGTVCILLQGKTFLPAGVVLGQGVRCVGGSFDRLYAKYSPDGSFEVPDFLHGEEQVSARSEARGDPIRSGESRWYLVYYRDPVVVGGCDAWRGFNSTQTGQVTWSP